MSAKREKVKTLSGLSTAEYNSCIPGSEPIRNMKVVTPCWRSGLTASFNDVEP